VSQILPTREKLGVSDAFAGSILETNFDGLDVGQPLRCMAP
jgi:hypothetical protein